MGLNWLDVDKKANLRIRSYIDSVATDPKAKVKGVVHLDSWDDTILYSAGCTWLDVCKHDRDFQFGTYAMGDMSENPGKSVAQIKFEKPYASKPNVILWFKDLDVSNSANCRVKTYTSGISSTGFTINIEKWADTVLHNARVTWIAHPASRSNIASGIFDTNESRAWTDTKQKEHPEEIRFGKTFEGKPDVFVGFNFIDTSNKHNLRLKAFATDIETDKMTMHIDTWFDTVLYRAGASWLAIQQC